MDSSELASFISYSQILVKLTSAIIMTVSSGLEKNYTLQNIGVEFQEFSRKYVRVPGKLSEIHSKVPLFSNAGGKKFLNFVFCIVLYCIVYCVLIIYWFQESCLSSVLETLDILLRTQYKLWRTFWSFPGGEASESTGQLE